MKNRLLINLINIFKHHNSPLGFTLIELLIATLMSTIVIGGAGYGLVSILEVNQSEQSKTQRQLELNRAMEFISEEVRSSNKVEWDSTTKVLKLTIPSPAATVLYSTASSSATNSIWITDSVVKKGGDVLVDGLVDPDSTEEPLPQPVRDAVKSDKNKLTCATTLQGSKGFYFCVYSDSRRVDLYMYGKVSHSEYVKVKTTAFARAKS